MNQMTILSAVESMQYLISISRGNLSLNIGLWQNDSKMAVSRYWQESSI